MNRIDRPRFSVHGDVLSTFYPRGCNRYNCRIGAMFCRKGRGHRRRGRAYLLATQERKRVLIAKFTPSEIDHLLQAVTTKLSGKNSVIALDRKRTPTASFMFQGIPIYTEEMQ